MPAARKYAKHPDSPKVELYGVSFHPDGGYYLIHPESGKRIYFGKNWQAAKSRWDELTTELPIAMTTAEAARDISSIAGEDIIDAEIVEEWRNADVPSKQQIVLAKVGIENPSPDLLTGDRPRRIVDIAAFRRIMGLAGSSAVHGHGLTVGKVGRVYRETYKRDRLFRVKEFAHKHKRYADRHESLFSEFENFIGKTYPVSDLKRENFTGYRDDCRKRVSKSGSRNEPLWVGQRLQAVKLAFTCAHREVDANWPPDMFGSDGFIHVLETVGAQETEKKIISPREFSAAFDVADTQWRAILLLTLNCGLRNRDVSDIEWQHIRWDEAILNFPRGKTGRKRRIPLAPQTIAALRLWRAETTSSLPNIFCTNDGSKWVTSTNSVTKHWEILKRQSKIRGVVIAVPFESMRDTAATVTMATVKTDPKLAVMMMLGQAPDSAWRFYVLNPPEFLATAADAIADRYFSKLTIAANPSCRGNNQTGRGSFSQGDDKRRQF